MVVRFLLVYNDSDSVSIVQSIASASTLISSVTSATKNYIISNFPQDFFKHIYVDSSEMITQAKENYRYDQILDKIPYPSLSIVPEFSLDDPIGGMQKSLHFASPNLFLRKNMRQVYKTLLIDPHEKIQIYYTSDYITTIFNYKITTNTYMSNIDIAYYLKSKFQADMFRYLADQVLQTEIPKSFIKCIANLKGLDISKPGDMNKLRLYLIGSDRRENLIEKKVNLATGKVCFFINDIVDFLTLFSQLDASASVIHEEQIEGEYQITFRFQVSTYLPNAFIMKIDRGVYEGLPEDIQDSLTSEKDQQDSGFYETTPMLSIKTKAQATEKLASEWKTNSGEIVTGQQVYHEVYRYEHGVGISEVNLLNTISPEFNKVHALLTSEFLKGYDLSGLLNVRIVNIKGEVSKSEYTFDFDNMLVKFKDPNYITSDILVEIFMNREFFAAILEAAKSKKKYFNSNFLSTIIGMIDSKRVRFIVRSFVKDQDMFSTNPETMLRVQTNYGPGYVSLKDISETNSEKDLYRICIGYDSENKPIIKTLEIGR